MNIHPSGEPSAEVGAMRDRRSALRQMTAEQLLRLGMHQVVYLKSGLRDGHMLFVLYGADGTPLLVADDADAAAELASERGLGFVAVH